jgi:type 1 glutamine amidotransferase
MMIKKIPHWFSQRFCLLAAAGVLAWSGISYSAEPPKVKPIKVLLVTGAEYHNWRETAPVLAAQLRKDPRMDVRMVEDAHFLDSSAVSGYDVIFLNYMNFEVPAPGEAAKDNLRKAIAGGKGLVLVHFACGAWRKWPEKTLEWPEFKNLAGRVWDPALRGHDPHGKFRVEIAMPDHPIMKGMPPFETVDELYTCLTGDRPIEVLATAKSKVDGNIYPMAFCFNYENGRVFHCVLGHDGKALEPAPVGELFRRGTAWAAGQAVK